jgi:hypothetical protein
MYILYIQSNRGTQPSIVAGFSGRELLGKSCAAAGIDGLGVDKNDRAARKTARYFPA